MKLVTSLLLGSVAGMAAVAGAQAADLPFRKAAPVEYVRVCDWTGAGYFYIPGTDTCIKFAGFVRAEYAFTSADAAFTPVPGVNLAGNRFGNTTTNPTGVLTTAKARAQTGFFTRTNLDVDTRTQTAYGTLRGFVRVQEDQDKGSYSGGGQITPVAGLGGNANAGNGSSGAVYMDKGYIQFAGITAGRVQSFFDLYADDWNYDGIANSDWSSEVLAYTATFGGGFSAVISVEDADERRDGVSTIQFGNTAIGNPGRGQNGLQAQYDGEEIPDIVGVLRVDQAWGTAQLSAAYHQTNTSALASTSVTSNPGFASNATADGFAVQGGVDIKLPMLAAGDELFVEGAYQDGAYRYMDSGTNMMGGFYNNTLGGFQHLDNDAVAVGIPGSNGSYTLAKNSGFSVMAALHHYFTPQFHDILFGSYEQDGYGRQVSNIDWTRGGIGNAQQYKIGNQFLYTPVHNFTIGLEVEYIHLDQTLAHEVGQAATALPFGIAQNPSSFTTRLRMERDF